MHLAVRAIAVAAALMAPAVGPAAGAAHAKARGPKRNAVAEIVIHATGGPSCQGGRVVFSPAGDVQRMKRFFEASGLVSIHYIVGRDGTVAASVPEDEVAVHTIGHNDRSIGIELINAGDGVDPYPPEQVAALATLVHAIRVRWSIPLTEVKGHAELDRTTFQCGGQSVRRKQDPGPLFPWDRLQLDLLAAEALVVSPRVRHR
jgi:N-acetyl-anhydromuramyl-L-alanine amidase AmpD